MVVNEIKDQIDKSRDNKIDTQELLEALEPDGFFSDSENLAALWELLNNWDVTWLDKDLLDSLEQSFYSIESQVSVKNAYSYFNSFSKAFAFSIVLDMNFPL